MSNVSEELISGTPQYLNALANIAKAIGKLKGELAMDKAEREYIDKFLKVIQNGDSAVFLAKDFSEKDFQEEMKKMGCVCETTRIVEGKNAGLIMCIFDSKDISNAMIAREKCLSLGVDRIDEYGNSLLPNAEVSAVTLNSIANDNNDRIKQISDIDEAKAKYIMGELRTSGVIYSRETHIVNNEKRINICIASSDEKKLSQAVAKANIEFSGISGNYARQKMLNEIRTTRIALNEIEKNTDEFYVVSANNPHNVIHMTNSSLKHEFIGENNNKVYREIGDKDGNFDYMSLAKAYKQEVDSMKKPVVLTKDEYLNNYQNAKEMKELVKRKMMKIIYNSDLEKAKVQSENFFKYKFNQRLYGNIKSGEFNCDDFKMLLNSVRNKEISLSDFLDLGNDEFAVNTTLDNLNKQKEELDATINGLSDEEYNDILDMYDSFLDEYNIAGNEIEIKVFSTKELNKSLKDLTQNIENNKNLNEIDTSDIKF